MLVAVASMVRRVCIVRLRSPTSDNLELDRYFGNDPRHRLAPRIAEYPSTQCNVYFT